MGLKAKIHFIIPGILEEKWMIKSNNDLLIFTEDQMIKARKKSSMRKRG
jgi:hypothetical protein